MPNIAMAQILVEGGALEANLARAAAAIDEAARRGCDAVVLPECLDAGWTHPAAREIACPVPGSTFDRLAGCARRAGVYVAAGLTECEGPRIYNAAVLIGPGGELLLKHRKLNELEIAHYLYEQGDRLGVAHTPLGTIGLDICADNFPDSLVFAHALARMGCQLLLSPCAWAVDAGHDNAREPYGSLWLSAYQPLARLYGITLIGVSNVGWLRGGPWAGRKCIGCSLAVGPDGEVLARGPYGEGAEALVCVDAPLRAPLARGTAFAPALRQRGYTGP
ncbi:MAG: carbon-nitrogen hydrolase family protein [Bryobacteraceae bacterium]